MAPECLDVLYSTLTSTPTRRNIERMPVAASRLVGRTEQKRPDTLKYSESTHQEIARTSRPHRARAASIRTRTSRSNSAMPRNKQTVKGIEELEREMNADQPPTQGESRI